MLLIASRLWYRKTSYKDIMLHPKILKIHLRNTSSNKIKSWPSRGSPSRTRTCHHQATRKQLKACITCNNHAARTQTPTMRLLQHLSAQRSGPSRVPAIYSEGVTMTWAASNQSHERHQRSVKTAILRWQNRISVLKHAHFFKCAELHSQIRFGYSRNFEMFGNKL